MRAMVSQSGALAKAPRFDHTHSYPDVIDSQIMMHFGAFDPVDSISRSVCQVLVWMLHICAEPSRP